ncbi:transmembrane protein adipocyte-associated 1 homolog isoform X2 [Oscarella lobularis]
MSFCVNILKIGLVPSNTRIPLWEFLLTVPSALFLFYLLFTLPRARRRFSASSSPSPIFKAFYTLVWLATGLSVIRGAVAMAVESSDELAPKLLWFPLHFIISVLSLSVLALGLFFGHLNSRQSIVWTLVITCTISAIFQATQAGLEIRLSRTSQTPISVNQSDNSTKSAVIRLYYLYGGNVFALTESAIVLVAYLIPFLLPISCCRHSLRLPERRLFYVYCLFVELIHISQVIGIALTMINNDSGYCILDVASYLYYCFLSPTIYGVFLLSFFRKQIQTTSPAYYKSQRDTTPLTESKPISRSRKGSFMSSYGTSGSINVMDTDEGIVGSYSSTLSTTNASGSLLFDSMHYE